MGYVYFIQDAQSGAIKIGHSCNMRERFATIQTYSPSKLNFLGAFFGDKKTEKHMHKCFEEYNIKGEWFSPTQELLDFASCLYLKDIASCPYKNPKKS